MVAFLLSSTVGGVLISHSGSSLDSPTTLAAHAIASSVKSNRQDSDSDSERLDKSLNRGGIRVQVQSL